MTEVYLIIGYGSIGKRHARNLLTLRPGATLVIVDPLYHKSLSLEEALDYPGIAGAIVASPTEQHLAQLLALHARGIPLYLEKPVCKIAQFQSQTVRDELAYLSRLPWKCALGFQYRFHSQAVRLCTPKPDHLSFVAQDDLLKAYGATVAETMASHSIDLALFAQGSARYAELKTDGKAFSGQVYHTSGAVSDFDLHMDREPRQSTIAVDYERGGSVRLKIEAEDEMYVKALDEWLHWVRERQRPRRLSLLGDGLRVMELIGSVGVRAGGMAI